MLQLLFKNSEEQLFIKKQFPVTSVPGTAQQTGKEEMLVPHEIHLLPTNDK